MKTDSFSEASLRFAYDQAAETVNKTLEEFAEESKFFSFSVTNLGGGLSIDVECDTSLPVSTPAEKREQLFQKRLRDSQLKANKIADKTRKIQERNAKKLERQLRKTQRN